MGMLYGNLLFAFLGTVRITLFNFAQIWYSCKLIDLSLVTSVNFQKDFKAPKKKNCYVLLFKLNSF